MRDTTLGGFRWWRCAATVVAGLLALAALAAWAEAPDEELAAGRAAAGDGLFGVARTHLERYLREAERAGVWSPEADEALDLLARALHAQGEFESLLGLMRLERGWAARSGRQDAVVFWRAMALYGLRRGGDALAALEGFEAAHGKSARLPRVWRLRAWCRLERGDTAGALEAFAAYDALAAADSERGANLLEWGRVLLESGCAAAARDVLTRLQAEGIDPAVARPGRYWCGRARLALGEEAAAAGDLEAVCRDEQAPPPLRVDAWFAAAELAARRRDGKAAEAAWRAGLEQAEGEARLRGGFEFGRWLLEQDRVNEASPLLRPYLAAFPERPESARAQLALAHAWVRVKQAERALEAYRSYLETFNRAPDQADAHEGRAVALHQLGRYGEAASSFLRAGDLSTNSASRARCLFLAGDAYLANAQYAAAIETYARLVRELPQSDLAPRARYQGAVALAADGNSAGAEEALHALAREHGAEDVGREAWLQVAALREQQEDWQGAVQAYDDMLTASTNGPFAAQALYGRANAQFQLFLFGRALADFDRLLSEQPEAPEAEGAAYRRVLCLYWMGNDAEALAACRRFLADRPRSPLAPEARLWLARHYYNSGEFGAAQREFAAFAHDFPQHAQADQALLWAGRAAARRREYVQAVDLLTQLVKRYPQSERLAYARFAQADALAALANHAAAILIFDEIINKYGGSELVTLAWGRKGDCQFALGSDDRRRYEESLASYRVVANDAGAGEDVALQAEYKIGRCLEKMGRLDEALDQYYTRVVVRFLRDREKGRWHNENAKLWFTRAAFNAVDLLEAREDWRGAMRILNRVAQADVAAAPEARERMEKLRREYWWLF